MIGKRAFIGWGRQRPGERGKGFGWLGRAEWPVEWAEELSDEFGFKGENLGLVGIWIRQAAGEQEVCERLRGMVEGNYLHGGLGRAWCRVCA